MRVLVDSSAWYAGACRDDRCHDLAAGLFGRLVDDQHEVLTTSPVVVEAAALIQRRLGLDRLRDFRTSLFASTQIVWFGEALTQAAWDETERVARRSISMVDCSTAVAADMLDITHVFAFDPHFELWGLELLAMDHLTTPDADA